MSDDNDNPIPDFMAVPGDKPVPDSYIKKMGPMMAYSCWNANSPMEIERRAGIEASNWFNAEWKARDAQDASNAEWFRSKRAHARLVREYVAKREAALAQWRATGLQDEAKGWATVQRHIDEYMEWSRQMDAEANEIADGIKSGKYRTKKCGGGGCGGGFRFDMTGVMLATLAAGGFLLIATMMK